MSSEEAGGHGGRDDEGTGGATPDGTGGATTATPPTTPTTTETGGSRGSGTGGSGTGSSGTGGSSTGGSSTVGSSTGGSSTGGSSTVGSSTGGSSTVGTVGSGTGGSGTGGSGTGGSRTGGSSTGGSGTGGQGGASLTPVPQAIPATTGTLVPLYTYPTHSSWRTVIDAKLANPTVPVVAVINPASGPGAKANADYVNGIAALRKAGVGVLGYVSTAYTKRSESAVFADIDAYRTWYPETTGIFFDEQSNSVGGEDYYRRVDAYARSKAFTFTVGNPGADTAPSYVGTVDLILVYESAGLPAASASAGWHAGFDRRNFGIIPYGVPTLDPTFIAQAKANVGYLYITGDTLPNPWDSVPPYFGELLAQLAL